ncbi:DUF6046 domain-containing protein [Hymenobacter sp. B81]|uniref:DUF6046 domain-containing protein n=1 Tax=Hymenobacter sp. B81 TaxID=3344878 RepID=UPI0037DD3668
MSEITTLPGFSINISQAAGSASRLLPFPGVNQPAQLVKAPDFTMPPESMLGTPMYFTIKIGDVQLPNEPLITVFSSKNIVKTVVAGGNFTVKEIIGLDDYKINIKGYAMREGQPVLGGSSLVPEDYPEAELRKLANLNKITKDLPVTCQLLSYFNITRLVIEDMSFPPVAGAAGYFAYEINAVSDESSLAKLLRK